MRETKYFGNIVEGSHRAIKRLTRPMLDFKSFRTAGTVLAGSELLYIIRKDQFMPDCSNRMSFAEKLWRQLVTTIVPVLEALSDRGTNEEAAVQAVRPAAYAGFTRT